MFKKSILTSQLKRVAINIWYYFNDFFIVQIVILLEAGKV